MELQQPQFHLGPVVHNLAWFGSQGAYALPRTRAVQLCILPSLNACISLTIFSHPQHISSRK